MTTLDKLDAQITKLTAVLEANGDKQHALVDRMNPEGDIGGIRSRSARQKTKQRDRLDTMTREYIDAYKERETLRAMRVNYVKATGIVTSCEKVLETGLLKGQPLTKDNRKAVEDILKDNRKMIASIERKVGKS